MDIIFQHATTNAVLGILAACLIGWVIDKVVTWLEKRGSSTGR